ncbi:MAG: HlyD family secretion protein, partial [Microcystaceae cyanobacterium]
SPESSESPVSLKAEKSIVLDEYQTTEEKSRLERKSPSFPNRRWPIVLGTILLIAGAGLGGNWWITSRTNNQNPADGATAQQPPAVPVKLATVEKTLVEKSSELVGTLEARRSIRLKSEVEGRVSQILVTEGERIQQGQVIFSLDSDDLQAELQQNKAGLEQARARLAELQAGSRPEEIAQARASLKQAEARLADAQGGARPEEIAQAQAQLEMAKAEAELARQRVNRYRQLQKEGAISADTFDEYLKEERSSTAALEEAERRLAQSRKGRRSDIDELAAAVEQARQNLRKWENGPRSEEIAQAKAEVAQAVAQVRMTEVNFQKTKVVAPLTGIIGDIPIKLGDYVSDGDELTTITENNSLELNLSVPLEKASALRSGLPVEILDAQGESVSTGKISFISPDVSASSQGILAKATFTNFGGTLLNRQFVQAKVIWDKRPG